MYNGSIRCSYHKSKVDYYHFENTNLTIVKQIVNVYFNIKIFILLIFNADETLE